MGLVLFLRGLNFWRAQFNDAGRDTRHLNVVARTESRPLQPKASQTDFWFDEALEKIAMGLNLQLANRWDQSPRWRNGRRVPRAVGAPRPCR